MLLYERLFSCFFILLCLCFNYVIFDFEIIFYLKVLMIIVYFYIDIVLYVCGKFIRYSNNM